MKSYLQIPLHLIMTLIVFSCFGQNLQNANYKKEKKDFTDLIMKRKWSEPDKVKSLIEPIIVINFRGKLSLGASRLGGTPDLPEDIKWPKFKEHSMVFYGQLNLSDFAELHQDPLLPKKGILYFFSYFPEPESEFGAEYEFIKKKSEYKVIYVENATIGLKPTEFPKDLPSVYHFNPKPLGFELKFQTPRSIETWSFENANLNSKDSDLYDQILSDFDDFEEYTILGTPYPIQYGVDYDWAYSYTNLTDFNDMKQRQKAESIRSEFVNLLSFPMYDIFERIGYSNCYFGITKEDLKNKAFDKVVFIMQDT